jgi:hypothetical protein
MLDGFIRHVPLARSLEDGIRNLDEFGVTIHEGFLAPDTLRALPERLSSRP